VHSDVLTLDEHRSRPLHREFARRIEQLSAANLTVLDWGCGRGSDVAHLRQRGINAYGAEICSETIERGARLFEQLALDHRALVKHIRADNTTDYPSAFFDVLISKEVLEHIEDLSSAAREMCRVLKPGGIAIHLYPAHHCVLEEHLSMPFVHWLPKGTARRHLIGLFTLLGLEPRWRELSALSAREKADRYFSFSVNQTFYRSPGQVMETFERAGFRGRFASHEHDRVVRAGLHKVMPRAVLGWLLTNFVACVFVARKLTVQAPARWTVPVHPIDRDRTV
jgi:SAM-dependent methyltransferase